ncbi:glycosyltransferase family 4 protein [Brachybacterium sp. UMB0905]|uniref:glycosyltransferase family 4 protein n=1 Tax=Brachybacterium sp. UMB0905 TaxID=2069310 RepID=UPI001304172E|nr:glycosyltransferase family 4 protein [Brachybacterium sp. UMB0905]
MTERSGVRIVHLTTAHGPEDNRIVRKECQALADSGYDVHLVARGPKQRVAPGVEHHILPTIPTRALRMLLGPAMGWLRALVLRPDIVHIHDPELVPLGAVASKILRQRVIYDAHEDLESQVFHKPYLPRRTRPIISRFARTIEKLADRNVTAIVTVTQKVASKYQNEHLAIVRNYPLSGDYPAPKGDDSPNEKFTFGYVGAITEARGLVEMINATVNHRLVLVGPADNAAQEHIDAAPPHVTYCGRRSPAEIPEIIGSFDAGLVLLHDLPNHRESIPTKLIEYMAGAKPFIATDFRAWRELVGVEGAGYFCNVADPRACADAVEDLARNPRRARNMGRVGRKAFEEKLTFGAEASKLIALYDALLA